MNAKEVGVKLVALCNAGKNMEAIETLYADGVESVEVCGDESMPKVMKGIDAVRKKGEWWYENHDAHGGEAMGPYPNEDRFAVHFKFEVTPKVGPMAGRRITLDEVGLYTVADGKVVREEFFYDIDGMAG